MGRSYDDIVAAARTDTRVVSASDLEARLDGPPLLVDVREPHEWGGGVLPGARVVPRGILEGSIAEVAPDPDTEIVLYCSGDSRSALAAASLQTMGYRNVAYLVGGYDRWRAEARPIELRGDLGTDQRARYSRHIRLPEIGEAGQARLLESTVLVVGAGGLGSPAALYLAAAGVGTLGIIDFDVVDTTNLQRQILHNVDRVGRRKVESARETIGALNPDVKVEPYAERLDASNALDLFAGYDVVVDGTDNFPTRYLVNDAALHLRLPVVHGSIYRFEGQVTVFDPYAGPCYRCLFPQPPPPELAPSCETAGVLGVLPGVVGSIQATETIKLLLGIGTPLRGRLLTYDALSQEFAELRFSRDPACPACGDETQPPVLVDYDGSCRPA